MTRWQALFSLLLMVNLRNKVSDKVEEFLSTLSREEIARKSIEERGAIIVASSMDEAIDLMNDIAPEHLEVITKDPMSC